MKTKLFALIMILCLLFTSCRAEKDSSGTTDIPPASEVSTSVPDGEGVTAGNKPMVKCYYGERTGTDKTYTGLEPLPLYDFSLSDMTNEKGRSTKTISHSFGVAEGGKPHPISIERQKFFNENNYDALCVELNPREKVLYLTFDCGYENGYTGKILDALKDKGVKAAFFCTLLQVKANPEIIARMINEGHIVGNHSVNHPDFSLLSRQEMINEVKGFDDYMREHFGYSSFYFRYPQGKYSEDSLDTLNSLGYKCVFWSLAYADWDMNNQKGAAYAHDTVVSRLHPGSVILLHAVSPDNAAAIGNIIDTARNSGYIFRSLEDIKNNG